MSVVVISSPAAFQHPVFLIKPRYDLNDKTENEIPTSQNEEEESLPQPGALFEKISETNIYGEEEHFFRMNETDNNGTGWDFRNGK